MATSSTNVEALNSGQIRATWNALEMDHRQTAIETLNGVLTDIIVIGFGCRQAHWNVRGANFDSLHATFGDAYKQLDQLSDDLAERIATLGGIVRGTVQHIAADTTLEPFPALAIAPDEHLSALSVRLGAMSGKLRTAIRRCEQIDDPVTVHHLTDAAANIERLLWRIESHLSKD